LPAASGCVISRRFSRTQLNVRTGYAGPDYRC
jgi:hypothetical protein